MANGKGKVVKFTESEFESNVLELFRGLGWCVMHGSDSEFEEREFSDPTIPWLLRDALFRVNGAEKAIQIDEAIRKLHELFLSTDLLWTNIQMTEHLQSGIDVSYRDANGEIRFDHICIIDTENPEKNVFTAVNQWWIYNGSYHKRADIVLFVNGLPISIVELKSPSREQTDYEDAYTQLQNYMKQVPALFVAAQALVISDLATTKVGTITSPLDRFMEWKTVDGSYESKERADYETLFKGIFDRKRLIDIIANFSLTKRSDERMRILAGYHQYFAVKKAMACTEKALARKDGKIGVFWHTQGSGKSLSMVFYARQLLTRLLSATILVLTDRLDLNSQLYSTFASCSRFLRQEPVKATDGEHLYRLLDSRKSHGIIFANIQKFKDREEPLSKRSDIIVISDEAHRTQSNVKTEVSPEKGEIRRGFANIVRRLLPKASFIGFTGTPIESGDRVTMEVFGDYIDVYDMTQAVEDGATVPVYYESRMVQLNLDDETLRLLDEEYDKLAEEGASEEDLKRSKQENAQLHSLLRAPETIDTLCRDIVTHYEENRKDQLTGKAMIVAIDRAAGIKIYGKLIELRPGWKDSIAVVMTQGNQDPKEWNDIIGPPARKVELAKRFKDDKSDMKIAIVVDMWLTGFDVPSLATMYVYKPMKGHNLMQAIARVNRVFNDKAGGLVVDYIGIAGALKKAMHDYTGRDRKNYGDPDIKKTAYETFKSALVQCAYCMGDFDYSAFETGENADRMSLIRGGADIVLDQNNVICEEPEKILAKDYFLTHSSRLRQSATLCRSLLTDHEKFVLAFFEAVRTLVVRLSSGKKITKKVIDLRITELLKVAVKAEGVVEIFNTKDKEFSLFDKDFLRDVANMKEKNLAVELLTRLLEEHIKKYGGKNLTESEKFSEMLNSKLAEYLNGLISNEEVISELIKMAEEMKRHAEEGSALGLTEEEQAFYDAITRPQAVKDFYSNEELVAMTKELTEELRKSKTIDWRMKHSARAKMRSKVKRLLKKYKYPPEEEPEAINQVMRQCEHYADEIEEAEVVPFPPVPYQVKESDAEELAMVAEDAMNANN